MYAHAIVESHSRRLVPWSYLFGDQCSGETISDIVEGMSVFYTSTDDGVMRREQRLRYLRTSILGRVPPQGKTV